MNELRAPSAVISGAEPLAADLEASPLIARFRRRAANLRYQAFGVLGAIILLLGAAIWIFFSAANITKQDVQTQEVFKQSDDVKKRISEIQEQLPAEPVYKPSDNDARKYQEFVARFVDRNDELQSILTGIETKVTSDIASKELEIDRGSIDLDKFVKIPIDYSHSDHGSRFVYLPRTLDDDRSVVEILASFETSSVVGFSSILSTDFTMVNSIQSILDSASGVAQEASALRESSRKEYNTRLKEWSEDTADERSELAELNTGLEIIRQREQKQRFGVEASPQDFNVSVPFLIQTNVTRFGPMIVILFFTSILVNLYRYNIRLSAYYDARADALILSGMAGKPSDLAKYVSALSPDTLDIGKPPRLPTEYAVDLAKAAIGQGSKGTD